MSSMASQRVLLLALGSVSIAALFVWYMQSKKRVDGKGKHKVAELLNGETTKFSAENQNGETPMKVDTSTANDEHLDEAAVAAVTDVQNVEIEKPAEKVEKPVIEIEPVPEEPTPELVTVALLQKNLKLAGEELASTLTPAGDDKITVLQPPDVKSEERSEVETEDQGASSGERSVSDGDYEIDEPSVGCEKQNALLLELSSHVTDSQMDFSWSEEMERCYLENLEQEQNRQNEEGYVASESPGVQSNHSEASSQDSGRATGGLASSLSPMDEIADPLPMYEFEIPNSLVGLVIGIKGKTIRELSLRTDVRMLIRQHHTPDKVNTHQICQVRGKRDQINRCLQLLRRRFPPSRFPELNLQPVLPPPMPNNLFDALTTQPTWLTLPENVQCEVVCPSQIDAGHLFLHQPTHPTFSSLSHLDRYMFRLYSQAQSIPELPKPCTNGLLCACPVLEAWFRAVTIQYFEGTDEVLVRFIDYGGYTKVPRTNLKQIRTDLMSLPFQAVECFLAHVQPVDGTWQWSPEANATVGKLLSNKVFNAKLVGYHVDEKVPMVELTVDDGEKTISVDKYLLDHGMAKAADPTKMTKPNPLKRPSVISQTSIS